MMTKGSGERERKMRKRAANMPFSHGKFPKNIPIWIYCSDATIGCSLCTARECAVPARHRRRRPLWIGNNKIADNWTRHSSRYLCLLTIMKNNCLALERCEYIRWHHRAAYSLTLIAKIFARFVPGVADGFELGDFSRDCKPTFWFFLFHFRCTHQCFLPLFHQPL